MHRPSLGPGASHTLVGQEAGQKSSGPGAPVLTLHPVPAHRAEEVGVEAEGLVNFPKDLSDVPDLPRDGPPGTSLLSPRSQSAPSPLRTRVADSSPERKTVPQGRESWVTAVGSNLEVKRGARQDMATVGPDPPPLR